MHLMGAIHPHIPAEELAGRRSRCSRLLAGELPDAGGLLIFSRLNIYYYTGTIAAGVLWLPLEGPPVLLCRRGHDRALLESTLEHLTPFRSFLDIEGLLSEAGSPLTPTVAAEMNGLSWSLSRSLTKHLPGHSFLPGDRTLALVRSVKSEWELERMRRAGARHSLCLQGLLPSFLSPGMTELSIAHRIWQIFFQEGHQGMLRMGNYGEELFLGHVSAGESANYPSVLNGPVGLRGQHPAVPFMGSSSVLWKAAEPLTVDVGFGLEGYVTDKTQVYWPGDPGSLPDQVREGHDFCVGLQERLAASLRPGALPSELASMAFSLAERQGWGEGFMALGPNKVSFIGHGIGLAIDEYPALARGYDLPLEEGMVIALEPKIGIPGLGMVGVENTFEVTPGGGRSLTGQDFGIIFIPPI
jgi:Xaa-Pro aminopeptidase